MPRRYTKEFLDLCRSVTAKRPKTVVDHILKHGHITTQELKDKYGYNHPPRAARDVRELGIPIETFRVTGSDGRKIAAYRFGDMSQKRYKRLSGRTGLSKKIKNYLVGKYGSKCFIYLENMDQSELQIDHRIPYEVAGDGDEPSPDEFMLLSGSANRAKSWSCEHCANWKELKDKRICLSCYWAYPEDYSHVAMKQVRRLDLLWRGKEVEQYNAVRIEAEGSERTIPQFIKDLIRRAIEKDRHR